MRPSLMEPAAGYTPETVESVLLLVTRKPPPLAVIRRWSPMELAVVFDWAIREHLAASDGLTRRRQRPHLVDAG